MLEAHGFVVVLGDIMVDILIKARGKFRPASDTEAVIHLALGGQGANVAVQLARLGVPVQLLAQVGDDTLGQVALAALNEEGVVCPGEPRVGQRTGALGVLIDGQGQRTMFPQAGANTRVDEAFVQRHWPTRPRALFVSGYALLRHSTRPAAQWAMTEARRRGIPVAVDPASYALIQDVHPEAMLEWMEPADMVFPNRDEGRVLSGSDDPETMLERLGQRFPLVALKLDQDGAWARAGNRTCRVPAQPVPVVDTTGGGDAFNAGFLAAYLAGETLEQAVAAGVQTAAAVMQRIGAT